MNSWPSACATASFAARDSLYIVRLSSRARTSSSFSSAAASPDALPSTCLCRGTAEECSAPASLLMWASAALLDFAFFFFFFFALLASAGWKVFCVSSYSAAAASSAFWMASSFSCCRRRSSSLWGPPEGGGAAPRCGLSAAAAATLAVLFAAPPRPAPCFLERSGTWPPSDCTAGGFPVVAYLDSTDTSPHSSGLSLFLRPPQMRKTYIVPGSSPSIVTLYSSLLMSLWLHALSLLFLHSILQTQVTGSSSFAMPRRVRRSSIVVSEREAIVGRGICRIHARRFLSCASDLAALAALAARMLSRSAISISFRHIFSSFCSSRSRCRRSSRLSNPYAYSQWCGSASQSQ
mmetsp:Transcript_22563/g.53992  ORF Transcript_22563/g.53992 Transcript_22563/m.53992 type:complete len:349 (-) Transcript_22563:655-1701(-)